RRDYPSYHAAPVPGWIVRGAQLLIIGLAPGMHGANATGRPFTGDSSGVFLFAALHRAGFASHPSAAEAALRNTSITNAVKCLPPSNKPVAAEIAQCRKYLIGEIETFAPAGGSRLRRPRCILCLGRLAHDAVIRAMALAPMAFRHGEIHRLAERLYLMDTYHPSRQNTNTGRLTTEMFDSVFQRIRTLL
ncbi:MAG: uracil-DNA glycosylase, partial [Gammaproteobacteria bacterium]|nr:uracil-DNA glycosylase [Gammaproteobacteria bacterium]